MKVLFDFELIGEIAMDSHLLDIMLSIKALIIKEMQPFISEIDKDNGSIIVTMTKEVFSIAYWQGDDVQLFYKLQPILQTLDWESVLQKFGDAENN